MIISSIAGGLSIGLRREEVNRWLAIPFGIGTALVLDETALLLELGDAYWPEEGVLSLQTAFATLGLLAALGYGVQVTARRRTTTEADWEAAAHAWDELQRFAGGPSSLVTPESSS